MFNQYQEFEGDLQKKSGERAIVQPQSQYEKRDQKTHPILTEIRRLRRVREVERIVRIAKHGLVFPREQIDRRAWREKKNTRRGHVSAKTKTEKNETTHEKHNARDVPSITVLLAYDALYN